MLLLPSSPQEDEVSVLTRPLMDEFLHNCDETEALNCIAENFHPTTMAHFVEAVINM